MKKYVLLFQNIEYGENASQAWHDWFTSVGPALIDAGNPFGEGHVVKATGSTVVPSDGPPSRLFDRLRRVIRRRRTLRGERAAGLGSTRYEALPM